MSQPLSPLGKTTSRPPAPTDATRELKSFSLSGGDPGARWWLRQVLRYQFASEAIRHARDQLAVLLAASSCVLWVAAAWPSLLAESLVRAALVVWAMLLAATLAAFGLERRWLRLQRTILRKAPQSSEGDSK